MAAGLPLGDHANSIARRDRPPVVAIELKQIEDIEIDSHTAFHNYRYRVRVGASRKAKWRSAAIALGRGVR